MDAEVKLLAVKHLRDIYAAARLRLACSPKYCEAVDHTKWRQVCAGISGIQERGRLWVSRVGMPRSRSRVSKVPTSRHPRHTSAR